MVVGRLGVNGGVVRRFAELENNIERDIVPTLVQAMAEQHAVEMENKPDSATHTLVRVGNNLYCPIDFLAIVIDVKKVRS